jgi:alkylation response protein AidB-like acyl-CoA dehydrogenase
MELILSDEQKLLNESAEKFFARLGGVKRARQLRNSEPGFDRDSLRKMADNGWFGMLVPEDAGGQQLGPTELALVMQQAGRALAPEPITAVALSALVISESNDAPVRDALLPALLSGKAVTMPAFQEPSGDIDLGDSGMKAERRGGEWRLTGTKDFVLYAGACDGFLVNARDKEGLVIAHVLRTTPGVQIKLSTTVEGRRYGAVTFRDAPSSQIVASGNAASAVLQRYHGLALVAAAAEMLGVMDGVIAMTLDYLKTRKQFGRPIGSFQALQHRAVDNYVLIESARSLLYQVCQGGEPIPASMASALKATASGAALKVGKAAVQLHGGIGFTDEYDVGLYLKRAMWLSSYLGNESAHQRRYARLS